MLETIKDLRDHAYGRVRRLIRKVLRTENTGDKQDAIMLADGVHYKHNYDEFQKYRGYRGFSNHGKCNPKHDRQRRVKGNRWLMLDKKHSDFIKIDNKENMEI